MRQHREDETLYVLEGEYDFLVEDRTLRVVAGSLLYGPKGPLHAHESVGAGVGRMLQTQTPGGSYERFFEEVGTPSGGRSGSLAREDQLELETIAAIGIVYTASRYLRLWHGAAERELVWCSLTATIPDELPGSPILGNSSLESSVENRRGGVRT